MEKSRRIWTKEETTAFLNAYSARKAEFLHTKKKKLAMANVLEDLISQGVLTQATTVEMLQVKLKNLLRAFKSGVDNNKRTGAGPCNVPYEDLMQEIFGERPIISNNHTLDLSGQPVEPLPVSVSLDLCGQQVEPLPVSATIDLCGQEIQPAPIAALSPVQEESTKKDTRTKKAKKSNKEKKEIFFEKKLKLYEIYLQKKLDKREEDSKAKERRHQEKMALFTNY